MKKSLIAISLLGVLVTSPALAAPPPAPPWGNWSGLINNWSGFYIGLNAGGASGANTTDSFSGNAATDPFFAANEFPTRLLPDPVGLFGGAQVGYNSQLNDWFIGGVEADIQGGRISGIGTETPTPVFFVPFMTSIAQQSNWFGTVRVRAGYTPWQNLLIYATGGLAYGEVETSFNAIATGFTLDTCPLNFTCTTGSSSSVRAGWTAGAGFELMLDPHWSIKAEYLYVDLGSLSATATPAPAGVPLPAYRFTGTAQFQENIVRAGVNWHFNWLAPEAPPIVTK